MEFLKHNYLWFIVGAIIIIMIIIGYIAEKTDFGHKQIEKKHKPKDNPKRMNNLDNVKIADIVSNQMPEQIPEQLEINTSVNQMNNPMETNTNVNQIDNQSNELSKEELEELSVPLGEPNEKIEELNKINDSGQLSEEQIKELSVPINSNIESKPIDDSIWNDKIKETKSEKQDVESEEDIWNF